MIHFIYRNKAPYFVPLCTKCNQPIEDSQMANLCVNKYNVRDHEAKLDDSGIFHKECDEPGWYPWIDLEWAFWDLLSAEFKEQIKKFYLEGGRNRKRKG